MPGKTHQKNLNEATHAMVYQSTRYQNNTHIQGNRLMRLLIVSISIGPLFQLSEVKRQLFLLKLQPLMNFEYVCHKRHAGNC